jgi:hypothetical protein
MDPEFIVCKFSELIEDPEYSKFIRKIFNFNDLEKYKIVYWPGSRKIFFENSISSAGCLFYKIHSNKLYLLLNNYNNPSFLPDDLGGKVELFDKSIFDTMRREVLEETNYIIDIFKIPTSQFKQYFYLKFCKYYLSLIEVDDTFFPDTRIFGKKEIKEDVERNIQWFDYNDIKPYLSTRLSKNINLIKYLNNIVYKLYKSSTGSKSKYFH